jgi:hypothetical protein
MNGLGFFNNIHLPLLGEGHESFSSLRFRAAASCAASPDVEPLRSFTIVGGIYLNTEDDPTCTIGLNDRNRLFKAVKYLIRSGVPVHPDFEVHLANFIYGEDYLASTYASDVVIISYVPATSLVDRAFFGPTRSQQRLIDAFKAALAARDFKTAGELANNSTYFLSRENSSANWGKRLAATRVIFSIYQASEIVLLKLPLPDHTVFMRSLGVERQRETYSDVEGERKHYGRMWELAVSHTFAVEAALNALPYTLLGACLKAGNLEKRPSRWRVPRRPLALAL